MSRRRRNETDEQRARRELISDFLSAANIQSMDDIQELFKEALSGFMEGSLESELDSELGYEPYDVKNKNTDNSRNGHSKKTLRTSNAIVRAINEFYNCGDDAANVLKSATDSVLSGTVGSEIQQIEQRLKDIDQARNDFVNLIATGACAPDSLDDEFARLYSEEEKLSQKLLSLKAQGKAEQSELADNIKAVIDKSSFELHQYADVLVRKVIECVKILNKEEISVTFKGGYEIKSKLQISIHNFLVK